MILKPYWLRYVLTEHWTSLSRSGLTTKPSHNRGLRSDRWRVLKRIRPSYLVLLIAVPFVVLLFLGSDNYLEALQFILPGVWTTLIVTVLAYILAGILGLALEIGRAHV